MKAEADSLKLLRKFWKSEIIASRLYAFLAERYNDDALKGSIIKFGKMELGHAHTWNSIAGKFHGISFEGSIYLKAEILLMKILSYILPFTIFIHYLEHQERHAILDYSKLLEFYKGDEKTTRMITHVIRHEISHEWQMMEQLSDKESYLLKAKEAIHGMTAGMIETLGLVIGLLAVHASTLIIGLTGLLATIGGLIAIMSISYVSAKGHYDLHQGKANEFNIKREIHPAALSSELQKALLEEGISAETARDMLNVIGDDADVLSNLLKTMKSGGKAVVPKEAVMTTSSFFIVGTLPILIPFFAGAAWGVEPLIPAIIAFVTAVIIISIAGLFIAVLSGKKISIRIFHNILIITGTCTATYLVGIAARIFFGIDAAH